MTRKKRTLRERGYTIAVLKPTAERGRYILAFARSQEPNRNGRIRVAHPYNGTTHIWNARDLKFYPMGFRQVDSNVK